MGEREKESEVEERTEVTEEGIERREEEEIEERPVIEEAVEEEERCQEVPFFSQESQGVCHFY